MSSLLTRGIVALGLIAGIGCAVWWQQHQLSEARDALRIAEQRARDLKSQLDQAAINERIVIRYVDRVQVVREAGKTIEKRIPVYVTQKANDRCVLPVGFVRVHDAAAQGLPLGEPAGDPDAPAAGLTLAAVADTVAGNYSACHETAAQLIALQDYVKSLAATP